MGNDLPSIDVDDVVAAANHEQLCVLEKTQIARLIPVTMQLQCGQVRLPKIAFEKTVTGYPDLPQFAWRNVGPVRGDNTDVRVSHYFATGEEAAIFRLAGWTNRSAGSGLGHREHILSHGVAGVQRFGREPTLREPTRETLKRRGSAWFRATNQQPQ